MEDPLSSTHFADNITGLSSVYNRGLPQGITILFLTGSIHVQAGGGVLAAGRKNKFVESFSLATPPSVTHWTFTGE